VRACGRPRNGRRGVINRYNGAMKNGTYALLALVATVALGNDRLR
jgi:hypothetical protein